MKKQLVLFLALALCLGLTACGDTESDDTQSGYETVMDMEFLDGMWSIDGTAKLYFNSTEGFYAYRTRWGLGGRGEFELSEASGRPMIFFYGLLYDFLLRTTYLIANMVIRRINFTERLPRKTHRANRRQLCLRVPGQ